MIDDVDFSAGLGFVANDIVRLISELRDIANLIIAYREGATTVSLAIEYGSRFSQ